MSGAIVYAFMVAVVAWTCYIGCASLRRLREQRSGER